MFPRENARTFVIPTLAFLVALGTLSGCKRADWPWTLPGDPTPEPSSFEPPLLPQAESPSPSSLPTASPTPIYIPQKRLETSRLFNGMQLRSTLETEPGRTATDERESP